MRFRSFRHLLPSPVLAAFRQIEGEVVSNHCTTKTRNTLYMCALDAFSQFSPLTTLLGFCSFPVICGGGSKYQQYKEISHLAVIKRIIEFCSVLATYHPPVIMIPLRAPFRSDGIMTVLGDIDIIPDGFVNNLTDNHT